MCGFEKGFELGHYKDPCNTGSKQKPIPEQMNVHLRDKLDLEISAGRIIGPFKKPPFVNFQVSPLNVKEKSIPGKFRMIHNLSYPHDGPSINDNIDSDRKSVNNTNVYQAINLLSGMKSGAFMVKSDIKDAFRLIPIRKEDHSKLGNILR